MVTVEGGVSLVQVVVVSSSCFGVGSTGLRFIVDVFVRAEWAFSVR